MGRGGSVAAQRKDRQTAGKSLDLSFGRNIKFNRRVPIGPASPAHQSGDLNQIWPPVVPGMMELERRIKRHWASDGSADHHNFQDLEEASKDPSNFMTVHPVPSPSPLFIGPHGPPDLRDIFQARVSVTIRALLEHQRRLAWVLGNPLPRQHCRLSICENWLSWTNQNKRSQYNHSDAVYPLPALEARSRLVQVSQCMHCNVQLRWTIATDGQQM